jgi:type II secretory pathway pseudopilin PulG
MRRGVNILNTVLVAIALIGITLAIILYSAHLQTAEGDKVRKQSINAMYYSLEHEFYAKHSYYPLKISPEILPTVGDGLFVDPEGHHLSDPKSDYRYEPYGCNGEICQGYTLRANLESEDIYIKNNN